MKYEIKYACGHGTYAEQIYGKVAERDSRAKWLDGSKVCADCYKVKMREQAKREALTAEVIAGPFGPPMLVVVAGDTYSIKDELKAAGCRWIEYYEARDVFGANRPKKGWGLRITLDDEASIREAMRKLWDCGIRQYKVDSSPFAVIGMQIARELEAKAAQKEDVAA